MSEELLPCPFCEDGGHPKFHKSKGVKCHRCGAWGPAWDGCDPAAWNTRQAPKVKALADEIRSHVNLDENHEAGLIPISTHLLLKRILSALETPETET